jgi:predicted nucleic acid-binding protein
LKIFLDTSALAKRYVQEPGSEELEAFFLRIKEVVVSTLSLPEFGAALGRKVREKEITKKAAAYALNEFEKDWENLFIKIPLTEAIAKTAASLTIKNPLKGADAVHLATAMITEVALFVVSDQQLLKTSEKMGLKAYNPSDGPYR